MSEREPETSSSPKPKRPYRAPRLVRYGTVLDLTRASLNKTGVNDGLGAMGAGGMGFFKSG